jgi:hypothetical protein
VLLDAIPADQAGLAAGILNSSRQVGGTLAVAVFGAMIAHRPPFSAACGASMLIGVIMLLAATAGALSLRRPLLVAALVVTGTADALGLGGGERPLERHPGAGQVLLGERDEQAVDHGQLSGGRVFTGLTACRQKAAPSRLSRGRPPVKTS